MHRVQLKGALRWLPFGGTQWLERKVGGLIFASPLHVPIFNHVTALTIKKIFTLLKTGFPCGSAGKEFACDAGDLGLIPGLGRSPGGRHGNPLQYSCLENPHGQRSLAGYSPCGLKELDTTEWLSTAQPINTLFQLSSICWGLRILRHPLEFQTTA